jgi:glucan phosphoethanolaminetransferase (alkaline phosphatase superfamily)
MGDSRKRPCRISAIAPLIHGLYAGVMLNFILSIATFAALLLLFGAWKLWRRDGAVQKMWLMVAAALVIFANIAIWVVPDEQGQSLVRPAR